MHEYVQKSTSTTLPRSSLSDSGMSPGVLNQAVIPVKFGARPRSGRFVLLAMNTDGFCVVVVVAPGAVVVVVVAGRQVAALRVSLVGGRARRLPALEPGVGGCELVLVLAAEMLQLDARRIGRLDVVLQGARVPRDVALEGPEPVERDGQRGNAQHDARHLADGGQVVAQRRPGRRGALGHHGEHEERHGHAQCVEERDQERGRARPVVRRCHRDRGEDGAGARHEDQAETQAENEAAPFVGVSRGTQPGEGPLNDLAHPGDQEPDGQQAEQDDAQPEQEVLGQMEEAEQRAGEEDGETEAHHQPGDDHVGPPLVRSRRAARHDDGDHGDDAGGQPGDQPTEERDEQELTHGRRSVANRERAFAPLLWDGRLT